MRFDVIVVGGGAAGCAMAARLSENESLKVVLIEAGESDRHGFTKIPSMMGGAVNSPDFDWRFAVEPDASLNGRRDVWSAGKCLGGGTAINGMTFVRGHRADYDRWADDGAAGWDYESVLPYFKRMETNERGADDYRGGAGPLNVAEGRAHSPLVEAWIEAALDMRFARNPDLNGAKAEGVDFMQVTQKNGIRHSTAAAYLDPTLKRKNLEVISNAQVTRIRFDGARAIGIDYAQHNHIRSVDAALGVVVCAGAINSPRLLMLSGVGPAAHLTKIGVEPVIDLPGVGGNLQERPGLLVMHDVNVPTLNSEGRGLGAVKKVLDFGLTREGALTLSLGQAHALVRTRADLTQPNVHLEFAAFGFELDGDDNLKLRKVPSISTFASICSPRSRGQIALRSNDPFAPPAIDHQLLGHPDDVTELAEAAALARTIIGKPSLAKYVTGEAVPGSIYSNMEGLQKVARERAAPCYHLAGTCKMGIDPMAVVDPSLKVRGVEGLWVADASVMPSLPSGGTMAASIMIGEKGADLVQGAIRR